MDILRGLLGIVVLLGIGWALSCDRKAVNLRIIVGGLLIQLALAWLVLDEGPLRHAVGAVSGFFVSLLGFTKEGAAFVFGGLADREVSEEAFGVGRGFFFAFQVLPTIVFFSALTSLLYYLGILQKIVWVLAWVMSRLMRLSGAESLAAAANVFVGQTEAPLLVKPYIPKMTRSEMMALMAGGMATIAGGVLAAYIGFLGGGDGEQEKRFATMLLCASLMNAPAALIFAKLMVPETGEVNQELAVSKERIGSGFLDAIANGTGEGLKLALNVAAMLIVFLAMIAMVDAVLGWVGEWSGVSGWIEDVSGGTFEELSLGVVMGAVFAPLAWVIGIGGGDVLQVGQLLGLKVVANEFLAYLSLGDLKAGGEISERSVQIATFALCGFANLSSIGIQLGGIGGLAPEQRPVLASLGFRAMVAGALASLLSATVAGMVL